VLWGADKANRESPKERSSGVGTPGNSRALSAPEAPPVEKRLLRALTAGGERIPFILSNLNDDFLTDPRVRRVVAALRGSSASTESVDFQGQIADLTEEERTFLSGIALDESPEPTEKGVDQLLKDLEISHLKGESAALQQAIKRAEDEGSRVDELVVQKQGVDKRIAQLRSRKG
jgi:hypothetical protein